MPMHDHASADDRRRKLMELLAPIHDRAQRSARRLCRSDADGDDRAPQQSDEPRARRKFARQPRGIIAAGAQDPPPHPP